MTNQFSSNRIGSPPPAELEHQRDSLLQQATEAVSRHLNVRHFGSCSCRKPGIHTNIGDKKPLSSFMSQGFKQFLIQVDT